MKNNSIIATEFESEPTISGILLTSDKMANIHFQQQKV